MVLLDYKLWQSVEKLFHLNLREKSLSMESSILKHKEFLKLFLISIQHKEKWIKINVINLLLNVLDHLPVLNFMRIKLMDYLKNMTKIKMIYYSSTISLNFTKQHRFQDLLRYGLIYEVSEFKETLNLLMKITMK